jgi:hypothetical protein
MTRPSHQILLSLALVPNQPESVSRAGSDAIRRSLIQPLLIHARRVPGASARQLLRAVRCAHAHKGWRMRGTCTPPQAAERASHRSTDCCASHNTRQMSQVTSRTAHALTLVLVAPWQPPSTIMFRPSVTAPNIPPANEPISFQPAQRDHHLRITFAGQCGAASPPTNARVEDLM